MVDIATLRAKMREKKLTILQAAETAGMDQSTLYRKLSDACATLSLEQAEKIASALGLSPQEEQEIFFCRCDPQQNALTLREYPTCDLVNELTRREGVEQHWIGAEEEDVTITVDWGPARVLVVTD